MMAQSLVALLPPRPLTFMSLAVIEPPNSQLTRTQPSWPLQQQDVEMGM